MLTETQRRLLTAARLSIEKDPATYDQENFGDGNLNCDSPGCIAAHILAADPRHLADARPRLQRCTTAYQKAQTIGELAEAALELQETPALFIRRWAREWFKKAGAPIPMPQKHDKWIVPTSTDATTILEAILDGRINDGLACPPKLSQSNR